jgi:hypothetical protein
MTDNTPSAPFAERKSDFSHNEENIAATVDPVNIPDPSVHLREAK